MIDRLVQLLESITWQYAVWATVLSIALFIASFLFVAYFLARLPATYFRPADESHGIRRRPGHWVVMIFKNALGVVLLLIGAVMAIPGIPGQGVMTMLVGLMLIDFPGKRSIELAILRRPPVLATVNRLRAKFGKPPLIVE